MNNVLIFANSIEYYAASESVTFCYNLLYAAVDMLAWSPDGSMYIMVTNDRIDICSFEVCNVNFCIIVAFILL